MAVAVAAALVWSNISGPSYVAVWSHGLRWSVVPSISTVRGWIDDGLMTLFFFAVGLEIGRERANGSLRGARNAALPMIAAAGGMAGAALAYLATAHALDPAVVRGWGVPMATDVAFTLGAMALLGRRVPPALRAFVLALAVADDVGSVLVLAVVSSARVEPWALAAAVIVLAAAVVVRRWAPVAWWPYALAAVADWLLLARAGVEPALAGAFVGMVVPCAGSGRASASGRIEARVAAASILGVLPVFVLASSGVTFSRFPWDAGTRGVLAAVLAARMVGKTGGIALAAALLVGSGVVCLPAGIRWRQLVGAAAMCGMGFTVPLLFAAAVFSGQPGLMDATRLGLLGGTVAAFGLGAALLCGTGSSGRTGLRSGHGQPGRRRTSRREGGPGHPPGSGRTEGCARG